MLYETDLSALKRVVPFPFPVERFGRTVGEQRKAYDFYFTDKFEVCIRISSGAGRSRYCTSSPLRRILSLLSVRRPTTAAGIPAAILS